MHLRQPLFVEFGLKPSFPKDQTKRRITVHPGVGIAFDGNDPTLRYAHAVFVEHLGVLVWDAVVPASRNYAHGPGSVHPAPASGRTLCPSHVAVDWKGVHKGLG